MAWQWLFNNACAWMTSKSHDQNWLWWQVTGIMHVTTGYQQMKSTHWCIFTMNLQQSLLAHTCFLIFDSQGEV